MSGRGGGRPRGRGRGRGHGRAERSPSPSTPPASSSSEMDVEPDVRFEFVLVLKGDPRSIQRLPDSFANYVAGDDRPRTMHLREAACGYYRWIVDVIYDARGKMYLNIGSEKFARHHSLQAGFTLLFSYFGDRDMSVRVFDEMRCRRDYHGDSTDEEDD
ncbi:hypothetical protein QYE76_056692 [Lolium multiflorum]|uniref:TF-B3 domain-containing protein n=1 Tax=Lolium multiflorum TaxID=4521 RepID=A0AAD8T258_LOLMU|nr:hypothetical protein QYE76_056692 [Lolium multiflorum]